MGERLEWMEEFLDEVDEVVECRWEVVERDMEISGGRVVCEEAAKEANTADGDVFDARPGEEVVEDSMAVFSTPAWATRTEVGWWWGWVDVEEDAWPEDVAIGTMVGFLPPLP